MKNLKEKLKTVRRCLLVSTIGALIAAQPCLGTVKQEVYKKLQGQITGISSSIQKIGHLKQYFLEHITLELEGGTYAHCWLQIKSEYPQNKLKKEYIKDISEKSLDLETAIVYELNKQNVNRSKAFLNDRDWVLGNYKINDKLSDRFNKWLQGKHYLIKELHINGKTFKFG